VSNKHPGDLVRWINDRDPTMDELHPVFSRPGYTTYGGQFLVTDGTKIWMSHFTKPPRDDGTYYPGYWPDGFNIVAWMPLPDLPTKDKD